MSDDKPKPIDDLKEGLNLLFRAAKGAVEKLPTAKVEEVAKDAVKEVSRAFDSLNDELDKAFGNNPPPRKPSSPPPPPEAKHYDDGYAPEPPPDAPRGPRIG